MASLQVTCINKTNRTNPHERISHLAGAGWRYTEDQVINYIEARVHRFHVTAGGYTSQVIVATRLGRKYIKTTRDGETPDNLLSLPECTWQPPRYCMTCTSSSRQMGLQAIDFELVPPRFHFYNFPVRVILNRFHAI